MDRLHSNCFESTLNKTIESIPVHVNRFALGQALRDIQNITEDLTNLVLPGTGSLKAIEFALNKLFYDQILGNK